MSHDRISGRCCHVTVTDQCECRVARIVGGVGDGEVAAVGRGPKIRNRRGIDRLGEPGGHGPRGVAIENRTAEVN